ncbi:MAG: T9SS type A sorting domain-containing protein [Bacteroidia bacterium]
MAVFNALGKTVMTSSEKSTNATLNIQNLSPGIYFVMVKFNNTYSRHKLIISR